MMQRSINKHPHPLHKRAITQSERKKQGIKRSSEKLEEPVMKRTKDLRRNEEKLRSIFTASPDAITVTDLDGNIIDCNQAALEMHGAKSRRDLIGKNALELITEEERQRAIENLRKTLEQGSVKNIEYSLLAKNGTKFPAELSASVVRDASGNPTSFVAITKNITERKRAEEALSESEKKYRSVVDNIGIGVAVINPSMKIIALNNQMKKWFPSINTSRKPVCYKTFNNPPRKNICSYCPTHKTLRDGKTHESVTNTPMGNKTINYRVISSPIKNKDGRVAAAIEVVEDITEQKRMEDKLKHYSEHLEEVVQERTRKLLESEERFRSVADYASEAIITIDDNATIVFWNKAAETIFGYLIDEAIGQSITLIMPKWAREYHRKLVRRIVSTRKTSPISKAFESTGLRKDGKEFPMELSFSTWKTTEGIFSTGIIRDTTERSRMEDERKSHEERLSALNICGGKLNAARNLDEVYKLTLDAMERTLGFEHAAFMIIENEKLKPVCQRGYSVPLTFELPLNGSKKGVTVRAVTKRMPILVSDATKDKDYVQGAPDAPPGRSELAVPVIAEDNVLGVLNVESKERNAFDDKDMTLLQILASHAATAISNLKKRDEIEKRSNQQASLMKSSAEMIHSTELSQRLQAILDAIKGLGWRRVVLSVRDENLDITNPEDIVTAGLTNEEREYLWSNRKSGKTWSERLGPDYERFRIGEFYYLPWSDPFVRKRFSTGTISSHLRPQEMIDWNPDDLLYAPLRLADGRIVGIVSIDDPVDGRRPNGESLAPLELFLHQAAVAIENARLIKQINDAKTQIQEYAGQLEIKVKERTRELVDAQNRLLKTERLAAIGELAGMVGHDLRNPLTGIAGATYYLKTKFGPKIEKKAKEMLKLIEDDIEHSNKIINDLLEYSREIKLELTATNPKSMLKETMISVRVPKNIQILDKTQRKPNVKADMEKTRRVFTNIVKNAFDAMPNGGKLTILSRKMKNNVVFSFSDTGSGMTRKTIDKLWTPLFTTKAKGMGFGLPICKRVVEGHGGHISVKSTLNKGSTFTVTLPIEPKAEEKNEVWLRTLEPPLLATTTKTPRIE